MATQGGIDFMRALMIIAVVAALGWGGYWFVGSRALDTAVSEVLERSPELSASSHEIRGFPNRFDITFNAPRVATRGLGWSAPFAQIFALSYRLNHIIAVFANDQVLRLGRTEFTLHSEDLRASVEMEAGLDLPLEQAVLTGEGLELRLDGLAHQIDGMRAALRPQPANAPVYDAALVLETVFPASAILNRLDPAAIWPRRFETLRLDAELEFTRPLDRHMTQGAPLAVERMTVTGAQMDWSETQIRAEGRLTPDAQGRLQGDMTLRIAGWRDLLDRSTRAGLVPADQVPVVTIMAQGLTTPESPETVALELSVRDGVVSMGPLTLGVIPPLN